VALREEHTLRVCEKKVLRRIFCPKGDEVTRGWSKPHKKELHDLCSSPSVIRSIMSRMMRFAGHVARMGRRGSCIGLAGEPEGKRPRDTQRHRWVDNIETDDRSCRDTGWSGVDRDEWRPLLNAVMNLGVP
jgi:hypothetical protein